MKTPVQLQQCSEDLTRPYIGYCQAQGDPGSYCSAVTAHIGSCIAAQFKLAPLNLQKGEAPEALAAAKKELEIKRAASASKGAKVFYKVTVKVSAFPRPFLCEQ